MTAGLFCECGRLYSLHPGCRPNPEAEAAPAEGVDLEALLPYIHHSRPDRPVCEATKQSGRPCSCGLDELLRSLKGRAALSRSEAAPKAAESKPSEWAIEHGKKMLPHLFPSKEEAYAWLEKSHAGAGLYWVREVKAW